MGMGIGRAADMLGDGATALGAGAKAEAEAEAEAEASSCCTDSERGTPALDGCDA